MLIEHALDPQTKYARRPFKAGLVNALDDHAADGVSKLRSIYHSAFTIGLEFET